MQFNIWLICIGWILVFIECLTVTDPYESSWPYIYTLHDHKVCIHYSEPLTVCVCMCESTRSCMYIRTVFHYFLMFLIESFCVFE